MLRSRFKNTNNRNDQGNISSINSHVLQKWTNKNYLDEHQDTELKNSYNHKLCQRIQGDYKGCNQMAHYISKDAQENKNIRLINNGKDTPGFEMIKI